MWGHVHPRGLSTEPLAIPFASLILLSAEPALSPSNSTSGHTLPPSQPEIGRELRGGVLTPFSPTLEDPTARSLYLQDDEFGLKGYGQLM